MISDVGGPLVYLLGQGSDKPYPMKSDGTPWNLTNSIRRYPMISDVGGPLVYLLGQGSDKPYPMKSDETRMYGL